MVEIIAESFNLMQMSNKKGKYYHHDVEQLDFCKKVNIKTYRLSKKKKILEILSTVRCHENCSQGKLASVWVRGRVRVMVRVKGILFSRTIVLEPYCKKRRIAICLFDKNCT